MSGISQLSDRMKKKLSFGDYAFSAEPAKEPFPVAPPIPSAVSARKIYTLSKDDTLKLQEIFSRRLGGSNQTSLCEIMSEAIDLLLHHELPLHVPDRG